MKIGKKEFVNHHTHTMGILNVTPDSFSDGGKYSDIEQAVRRAEEMIAQGADILDVGGESTRPGYVQISEAEEIERTARVIERLKAETDIPVSIDTYKASVAEAALQAGADMVNDIWGLKYDDRMAQTIAKHGASCCLMHNRKNPVYQDFMAEVGQELKKSIKLAQEAGIDADKIILDPGVGFAKSYEQNLEIIYRLEQITELGYPVLLGTSRKSVIGLTLDLPTDQRLEGTLVTTVYAVLKGCMFVRVHDVRENVRAIKMAETIRDGWCR